MYFDQKECGKRIKYLIKAYRMTQTQFADKVNTSPSYLRKILSGCTRCSLDLLIEMACYFNVSLDYLLLDKGKDEADMQKELLEVIENLFRIAQKM